MWFDILAVAGSIASIIAIPAITLTYWQVYKIRKAALVPKGVSEDCLEFLNEADRVGVNLVPLSKVTFLPRPGDTVLLPGTLRDAGFYEVIKICHSYTEETEDADLPGYARPIKVIAYVEPKSRHSGD